tara:strand:+ start:66 stop:797 length:732 start_codon:yes stop_codon:yes gene_type:complete
VNIIKLSAIGSTNSYLLNLSKTSLLDDFTVVIAKHQTKGRGQQDAVWQSVANESLSFSVFKAYDDFSISKVSSLTFAVSLAIVKALEKYRIPDISIKWPNDIMSQSKKMAGILIENKIKKGQIVSSIIGIGLNVNQEIFNQLPQVTSMYLSTHKKFDLDYVFKCLLEQLVIELEKIEKVDLVLLKKEYESFLFRKDMISVFEDHSGKRFNGIIQGVSAQGQIVIETETRMVKTFQPKKIKLLF